MSLSDFFRSENLAPHGICLLWRPELIWTHVVSDALIGTAYFSIPVALLYFSSKRRDLSFGWIFWCFAIFILACGATHFFSIWTLWHPDYGSEAVLKAFTAGASLITASVLWPLLPKVIKLPSPDQLRIANEDLEKRISERDTALAALSVEVNERVRVQEALRQSQKIEALGQITGGVAHDFNNLLAVVLGNLEILRKKLGNETELLALIDHASQAGERGAALTQRMLAFARRQSLSPELVDIRQLVESMESLLQRSVGPRVQLHLDLSHDVAPVLVDTNQLELAIINLAVNARDAMPDGGTLNISISQEDSVSPEAGDTACTFVSLRLTDSGEGMDEQTLARAMEPFFTTKPVGSGTGLGLSMVHGLVTQSGGRLVLTSKKGAGTTVDILLPAIRAQIIENQQPRTAGPASASERKPRTILVVDDDKLVRQMTVELLEDLGHHCIEAGSGAEALDALSHDPKVDCIITDHAMPGMTGLELAEKVSRQWPAIPLIIASGYADLTSLSNLNIAKLAKPFMQKELADALLQATAQSDNDRK